MSIQIISIAEEILEEMRWTQGLKSTLMWRCPYCKGKGFKLFYNLDTDVLQQGICNKCGGTGMINDE